MFYFSDNRFSCSWLLRCQILLSPKLFVECLDLYTSIFGYHWSFLCNLSDLYIVYVCSWTRLHVRKMLQTLTHAHKYILYTDLRKLSPQSLIARFCMTELVWHFCHLTFSLSCRSFHLQGRYEWPGDIGGYGDERGWYQYHLRESRVPPFSDGPLTQPFVHR